MLFERLEIMFVKKRQLQPITVMEFNRYIHQMHLENSKQFKITIFMKLENLHLPQRRLSKTD